MDFEVIGEGLQFPEGPIAMQDDSVILVEIARRTLTRAWNGRTDVIAHLVKARWPRPGLELNFNL